jgi:hypothetical protein
MLMQRSSTIKTQRMFHRYLGLFFAPAILFFSLSGALQVFGWHQAERGSNYTPARWILILAQLHKKQTMAVPAPKAKAQSDASIAPHNNSSKEKSKELRSKFVLQCFVFVMSIALMVTTFLGILMALQYGGNPRTVWIVILFGCLFPAAVLLL